MNTFHMEMTSEEHETVTPDENAVVGTVASHPLVPTVPSCTPVVSSDFTRRYQDAVPVNSAAADVIALAVFVPPDAAPKAVDESASFANLFCVVTATSGDAGCVPS